MKNSFDLQEFTYGEQIYAYVNKKSNTAIYIEIIVLLALSLISFVCDGFLVGSEVMSSIINGNKLTKSLIFIASFIIHIIPEGFWAFNIMKRLDQKNNKFILTQDRAIEVNITNSLMETKEIMLESVSGFSYRSGTIKFIVENEVVAFYGFRLDEVALNFLHQKFPKINGSK